MTLICHSWLFLWDKKYGELGQAAGIEATMEFAFVAAVGGVGLENVAVAEFQFFEDDGLVDDARATVVG
jgi:hypothetical protein